MSKTVMYLDFVHELDDGRYRLEGYLGGAAAVLEDVVIRLDDTIIDLKYVERIQAQEGLELHNPISGSTFEAEYDVDLRRVSHLWAESAGRSIPIRTNRFTGLSTLLMSYKLYARHIFMLRWGKLTIYPMSRQRARYMEMWYMACILVNWRIPYVYLRYMHAVSIREKIDRLLKGVVIVGEAIIMIPRAIYLRLAYRAAKRKTKRPIWIISDRVMAAGDNGEALFRYIAKRTDVPADVYFAISKKSPDYARMQAFGNVIDYGSLQYKLLFLLSSKVISSQADVEVINPFLRQIGHFVDLFNFDFVFLQHGIIRYDLSEWLNRFNRNISLFITSSRVEYNSILSHPYYYSKQQVVVSGLPRFDLLEDQPKNKLILSPTYRKFLLHGYANKNGVRSYDPAFKNSEYFSFYNRFMNDPRLLAALQKADMKGEFYLHPAFAAQCKDFDENDLFSVMDFPYDYKNAFCEGNVLISDYSSVMFDFAYLKKPILYAHFDADKFFAGHVCTKSDFFDDSQDGFGVVCHDYETLINETIRMIESGCKMETQYRERVDAYFAYHDQHNSERVYNSILDIGTQGE